MPEGLADVGQALARLGQVGSVGIGVSPLVEERTVFDRGPVALSCGVQCDAQFVVEVFR